MYQQLYVRYPWKPPETGHIETDARRPDCERWFAGMGEQFRFCDLEPRQVRYDLFFPVKHCLAEYQIIVYNLEDAVSAVPLSPTSGARLRRAELYAEAWEYSFGDEFYDHIRG